MTNSGGRNSNPESFKPSGNTGIPSDASKIAPKGQNNFPNTNTFYNSNS